MEFRARGRREELEAGEEPSASPAPLPRAIFRSPFSILQPCTISAGPGTLQEGLRGHSHLHRWQLWRCSGRKIRILPFPHPSFYHKKHQIHVGTALSLALHKEQELLKIHGEGFSGIIREGSKGAPTSLSPCLSSKQLEKGREGVNPTFSAPRPPPPPSRWKRAHFRPGGGFSLDKPRPKPQIPRVGKGQSPN